jgi:hypothetical protein
MAKDSVQADAAYKAMQAKVAAAKRKAATDGRGGWNKPAGGSK